MVKAITAVILTCLFMAAFFGAITYGAAYLLMAFVILSMDIGGGVDAARMLAGVVFFLALFWAMGHAIANDAYGKALRQINKVK